MYGFYYPETGQRAYDRRAFNFNTVEEAVEYWLKNHKGYIDITVDKYDPAFMNTTTGVVVVIREMKGR